MKSRVGLSLVLLCFGLGLLGFAGSGCRSTPKVDWNSRIGTYTFDQAVSELGPPDKTATLTDGRKVADWIRPARGGVSFGVGTGFSTGGVGVGVGQSVSPGRQDRVLRLTFDSGNRLVGWSEN